MFCGPPDWNFDMFCDLRWSLVLACSHLVAAGAGCGARSAGHLAPPPEPCDPRGPIRVEVTPEVRSICERLGDASAASEARVAGCVTDFERIIGWVNAAPTTSAEHCTSGVQKPPTVIRDCLGFPTASTLHDLTITSAELGISANKLTNLTIELDLPSLETRVALEGSMAPDGCAAGSDWVAKMWWHH